MKNLSNDYPVNQMIKLLYLNQKQRGHEGYGFIGLNRCRLDTYRSTTETGFFNQLNQYDYDEVILHHRLPTSTHNTIATTHPFVLTSGGKRYYFAHNGIIYNDNELWRKHQILGIKYTSLNKSTGKFNDSETLAWEFVLWLEEKSTFVEAYGSAAFVCLVTDTHTNRAERLYFYRNDGSPLTAYKDKHLLVLSSEGKWGEAVPPNQLYCYDYSRQQVQKGRELVIDDTWLYDEPLAYLDGLADEIEGLEQDRKNLLQLGDLQQLAEMETELRYLWQEYAEVQQAIGLET